MTSIYTGEKHGNMCVGWYERYSEYLAVRHRRSICSQSEYKYELFSSTFLNVALVRSDYKHTTWVSVPWEFILWILLLHPLLYLHIFPGRYCQQISFQVIFTTMNNAQSDCYQLVEKQLRITGANPASDSEEISPSWRLREGDTPKTTATLAVRVLHVHKIALNICPGEGFDLSSGRRWLPPRWECLRPPGPPFRGFTAQLLYSCLSAGSGRSGFISTKGKW